MTSEPAFVKIVSVLIHCVLNESISQICLELNYLIVHLEPECTPEVCPEMRAEEWMYYCATHPTPREVRTNRRTLCHMEGHMESHVISLLTNDCFFLLVLLTPLVASAVR
jgi:hypothetical protein